MDLFALTEARPGHAVSGLTEANVALTRRGLSGDCQEFRVWAGIMGKKESHYVSTQRAGDPVRFA